MDVGHVTMPTQVIKYNQNVLQADQPIKLQYSNQIKLFVVYLSYFHDNEKLTNNTLCR